MTHTEPGYGDGCRHQTELVQPANGLAVLTSLLESSDDEPSYLDRTGSSSTVGGGYPSGTGDTQIYDSGSITTTEDGELIYSDSSGNGFSSGG